MELDEWVTVVPMPTRCVQPIDRRDVHICVIDQRVREGHRPRCYDEVVGVRRSQGHQRPQ